MPAINVNGMNSKHVVLKILCNQYNGLNICHINAQSLNNKMDELRHLCDESEVDIVCVSETWFREEICDNMYRIEGFNIFRSDRKRHGGGVAIYIKNGIKCRLKCSNSVDACIEYLFVEVICCSSKLLVGCVYRPRYNIELTSFIEES